MKESENANAAGRLRDVVLATRSAGKLRELTPLLASRGWRAVTLADLAVPPSPAEDDLEQFDTFEANALAKARHFCAVTGRAVLADDSGLEVDALFGRPGVHSKRWSGSRLEGDALDAHNNQYLQTQMALAAEAGRSSRAAAYVCAAACAWPGGERVAVGRTTGRILAAPRGTGGFGYDPYFESSELERTFAEVERAAKETVSHRGRAFAALLNELEGFFADPVDPGAGRG